MKRITRRKLVKKVRALCDLMESCKLTEREHSKASINLDMEDYHRRRSDVFHFVEDYIKSNFRSLI